MESAPDSSLRILARVMSCEFTREAVSEISTSTVSLNKMSFKKFHPLKDFQSVPNTEKFSYDIHCSLRMQNAELNLTSVTETTIKRIYFSNNQFINTILRGYA